MKQNPYAGLKKVILASMILVPLVPFVSVLGSGYYYFTDSLQENTIASIQRTVHDHRQMIESFLMERKADLEFILNTFTFEDLSRPDQLKRTFGSLQKESSAFVDLGILDENGLHVTYHGPYQLSGKVYDQAPWFKAVVKNGFYISSVFLGYREVPHFVIAVVKINQDRQWVIRATIDSQIFNDLVKKVHIGKTGEAYLLDAEGVFQTERRSGGALMEKDPDRPKYGRVHDGIKTFIDADAHGETFLYATTWLKDGSWLLVVRQEKADAFKALRQASYLIVFISVLGGALIVPVAFFLTSLIIRRMEHMDQEKDILGEQPMFWNDMFQREVIRLAGKKIKNVMSPAPRTIDADANLMEAAYTMISQNKRRLTILDSGKVIGIIREQDLFFEIDRILREG